MTFNTEVVGAYWQEDKGEWTVKLRQTAPGHEPREFEDHCHMFVNASGILNKPQVRFAGIRPLLSTLEANTNPSTSGQSSPA